VTDADLILGYLDPGYFLGGRMQLSREKAADSIAILGASLRLDTLHAAWGIHRVVNASMANAATVYAAEKGRDLRRYTMVAFGGASPVHACAVADQLGSKRVIVPFAAGVTSAFGLLVTRPSIERVKAYMSRLSDLDWDEILRLYREMEYEGSALLRRMQISDEDIEVTRRAEMRYSGQRHQITVTIPPGAIESRQVEMIEQAFRREYAALYQEIHLQYPIEALNWKTSIAGPPRPVKLRPKAGRSTDPASAMKEQRKVCFSPTAGYIECAVYDRYRLTPGSVVVGPSVIEEKECTTVVRPGWSASVDGHLDIILTTSANSEAGGAKARRGSMAREKGPFRA
jgi:N-methylhydantoinase A/oxoprolinase/acetone carboxylase beta subunit